MSRQATLDSILGGFGGDGTQDGQWRLSAIECVNWGTFDGFHHIDIGRESHLVTGESGSGKSTIVDAYASCLYPRKGLRFNAAAQSISSNRSRSRDRSLVSYVRGAYKNEQDGAGGVRAVYKRPVSEAAWGAVMVTFACNFPQSAISVNTPDVRPINFVELCLLDRGCDKRDDVRELYVITRGEDSLANYQDVVTSGPLNVPSVKQVLGGVDIFATQKQSVARHKLGEMMGVDEGEWDRILSLLAKVTSTSAFDDVNSFVRMSMLGEPTEIFDEVREAREKCDKARGAYEAARATETKVSQLRPLRKCSEGLDELGARRQGIATRRAALDVFEYRTRVGEAGRLLERERREVTELEGRREQLGAEKARLQKEREGDLDYLRSNDHGNQMTLLSQEIATLERERARTEETRRRAEACLGPVPSSRLAWDEMMDGLHAKLEELRGRIADANGRRARHQQDRDNVTAEIRDIDSAVDLCRREQHVITPEMSKLRNEILHKLGLGEQDMAFVCEVVRLADECYDQQGYFEAVFHDVGRVLLVSNDAADKVEAYVARKALDWKVEVANVANLDTAECEDGVFVAREECDRNAYLPYAMALLGTVGDYDRPSGFPSSSGVYYLGTRLVNAGCYASTKKEWVFGKDNAERLAAYEVERNKKAGVLEEIKTRISESDEELLKLDGEQRELLSATKYAWDDVDTTELDREIGEKRARLEEYESGPDTSVIVRRVEETKGRIKRCEDDIEKVVGNLAVLRSKIEEQEGRRQHYAVELDGLGSVDEGAVKAFEREYAGDEGKGVERFCREKRGSIESEVEDISRMEKRREIECCSIMHKYHDQWPDETRELGDALDDMPSYLEQLNRLERVELRDAREKLNDLLRVWPMKSIKTILGAIEQSKSDLRMDVDGINQSLRRVVYNPVTQSHLEFSYANLSNPDYRDCKSMFTELAEMTQMSDVTDTDLVSYFELLDTLLNKMSGRGDTGMSQTARDAEWRRNVLDPRYHFGFALVEKDNDGVEVNRHVSDEGLSGGQKEKLVMFCNAAALRYQLSGKSSTNVRFGTVVVDEAFDKADGNFARTIMKVYHDFGFQLVIVTPCKLTRELDGLVGGATMIGYDSVRHQSRITKHYVERRDTK